MSAGAIAIAVAATAALAAPSGASAAVRTLRGRDFTTRVPAGWSVRRFRFDGARAYGLRAPAARIDPSGLARGGAIIDVVVVPPATVHRLTGLSPSVSPRALAGTVAAPPGVSDELSLLPVEDAVLGGAPAATTAIAYRSGTLQNVAGTVIANRGGTLAIVLVSAEPAGAVAAGSASRLVTSAWRWRAGAPARPRRGPFAEGFVGATAQGEAIGLDARLDGQLAYTFRFRPVCAALGQLPRQSDLDTTPIHTTRRFQDHFTDSYDPEGNPRPVIGGRARNLLLTTAADVSGRLDSRTLASGTLRERVAVMDRDLFPGGGVLDTCDTGAVPWRAARLF